MPVMKSRRNGTDLRNVVRDLEAACVRLRGHLFGKGYQNEGPGFIGIGANEILVYLRGSKRSWRGPRLTEWEGYPVKWRYGVGPIVAGLNPNRPTTGGGYGR